MTLLQEEARQAGGTPPTLESCASLLTPVDLLAEFDAAAKDLIEAIDQAKRAGGGAAPDELEARSSRRRLERAGAPAPARRAAGVRALRARDGAASGCRPVICLAVGEAVGAEPERLLPAARALELVHTFSLVHDDLPALDDDAERRGKPSALGAFGEGVAILAGDALLAEAFRLAPAYADRRVARELAEATLGMIGGQYLDITGAASTSPSCTA